jgi:DNA helicase IV
MVIDEAQDMKNIFYKLVCKILCDYNKKVTIVVAGDKYQGIYDFNDADTRYLTMANKLYNEPFTFMDFKTSYRVILQIAQFLNNHVIGYERIISANVNPNSTTVKYIICDKKLESTADYIIDKIVRKIKKKILM